MVFGRKKKNETGSVKLARTAGRMAGKAVRTGRKAAAAVGEASRATQATAGKVKATVINARDAARRAVARRKVRKTLSQAGDSLKTVGKVAAIAGASAAAAATVSEIVKRRRKA